MSATKTLQPFLLHAKPTSCQHNEPIVSTKDQPQKIPNKNRPYPNEFPLALPIPYTNLILDLGDVLAFYSSRGLDLPIDTYTTRHIITSNNWCELECGRLDRAECLSRLSHDFGVTVRDIQETLRLLASSLTYNTELVGLIRYLKRAANGHLSVYLATNVTAVDWEMLRPVVESWQIFDGIFTSFSMGARKPENNFYRQIFNKANINPHKALFIDDKAENVLAARVLGLKVIHFVETDEAIRELKISFGDACARGEAWLRDHAKRMWSVSNTGTVIRDNFNQLMMLENTKNSDLVVLSNERPKWNYFVDQPVLSTSTFPDDLDTTAMAFRNVDGISAEVKHQVMDEMLEYMTEDGLFNTYFDKTRPRVDLHITACVMRLFYAENRGHQVKRSLEYVCEVARTRAYDYAMRYYMHPDWFFYHLSELCAQHNNEELAELRELLTERLAERFGSCKYSDPWSLAMRLVAADNLGLKNPKDRDALLNAQQSDGSWSKDPWIYRYGHGVLIGHVGMITAVAVRALAAAARG